MLVELEHCGCYIDNYGSAAVIKHHEHNWWEKGWYHPTAWHQSSKEARVGTQGRILERDADSENP